jgi:ATP/maltotriose-dependent transcriptional regulator MalT
MSLAAFVGRERELAALSGRLRSAMHGEGGMVMIDGEPGIGKTTLAIELTRSARAAGMLASWGACPGQDEAAPFQPWVQTLTGLGHRPADEAVERATRPRFFADVIDTVRSAAAGRGLLLVLDDLHWADVPSLRLLAELAPRLRDSFVLVVGLYRGAETEVQPEISRLVTAVLRGPGVSRLVLGPMTADEVGKLVRSVLTVRLPAEMVQAIEETAEGNPLFAVELGRLADARRPGAGQPVSVPAVVPAGIRDVIASRLDLLPSSARALLQTASVLGREFSIDQLSRIADQPPDVVADQLDMARTRALLTSGDTGWMRFNHVLTQEVAYRELPASRRHRLHQRAGETLRSSPELVAYHLRKAVPLGSAAAAFEATLTAARHAASRLAYEQAVLHYQQALELLPFVPEATSLAPGLLVELAECQFRSGAVADAWDSCATAAQAARVLGDAVALGKAALVIRGLTNDPICDRIHLLCREALSLLGEDQQILRAEHLQVLRARLLGQLAVTANPMAGGPEPGLSDRALAAAEQAGDTDAQFLALQAWHADRVDFRCSGERLEIGARAVALGRDAGRQDYAAWGHVWRMDALGELGRRVELDGELTAYMAVVEYLREPIGAWRLMMIRASLAVLAGRFDEAAELAAQALAIGQRGGHQEADFMHLVFSSRLASFTGKGWDEVEAGVRRIAEQGPALAKSWYANVLAGRGHLDDARQAWSQAASAIGLFPRHLAEWIAAAVGSAEVCVLLGDREHAPALYEQLLPFADRQAAPLAQLPSHGPVALYLGRLAHLLDDLPAAQAHLEAALRSSSAIGSAPFEAITRLELGRVLLRREVAGQAAPGQAVVHLNIALNIAGRLGMTPLAEQAGQLLAAAGPGRPGPLSGREEQIAGLVAEGLSNRQIATRLRLSERTIETHLRSIFIKLDLRSRTQLAIWQASRAEE